MKDIDINQLISAYYDNELTEGELDYLLEATKKDPELLSKLKNYGLISVISEKDDKVVSIFTNISDFVQKRFGHTVYDACRSSERICSKNGGISGFIFFIKCYLVIQN